MMVEHGGDIYAPGREDILDFSVNTNPLGMPKKVAFAMRDAVESAHLYPDIHNRALVDALTAYEGLPPGMVFPGAGGADLIYRFAYAVRPGRALLPAPTFSEYERALAQVGTNISYYALARRNGMRIDSRICGHINRETDVVFLCNPNNPTGVVTDLGTIENVAKACLEVGAILFLDECFIDFVEEVPTAKGLLCDYPNLIILRAMTKNYAMAGVRVGYAMSANARLLADLQKAGPPWQISAFALAGALAATTCSGHLHHTREFLAIERPWLCEALADLGLLICPGASANYILFDAGLPDLKERMIKRGVLIRSCANYRGLTKNCYRVTIRTRADNERLIEALREARAAG